MSGRTAQILGRLPAHLEPTRVGKQLAAVTDSVAQDLDQLSTDLAAVRRSHRLAHADTARDVLLLGGLHGIGASDLTASTLSMAAARTIIAALAKAVADSDAATRDAQAEALLDLWGIDVPRPGLPLFAPPSSGAADLNAAAKRLVRAASARVDTRAALEVARRRVASLCQIHADGNASVRALIAAAASTLDLELDLDENARVKELSRPAPTVTAMGTAGTTSYRYVVVARSESRSVARQSAVVGTDTGNVLGGSNFNRISWAAVPDALDFLVYRTSNSADATAVGLITPTPLPPTTTLIDDAGGTTPAELPPELDDDLFHSRDLFWHSSFVRDAATLVRPVDAPPPASAVTMGAVIAASNLLKQLGAGVQMQAVLAPLANATGLEFWLAPDAAGRLAARFGVTVRFPDGDPIAASTLARLTSITLAPGRPRAQVARMGTAGGGTQSYGYVVVARDATGKVTRRSTMAGTDDGPAPLSATAFLRVTWTSVAGAADYLVYRVLNGGASSQVGLLTSAPLGADVTTFDDTGIAPAAGAPQDLDLRTNDLAAALLSAVTDGTTVDFTLPAAAVAPVAAGFGLPVVRNDRAALPPAIVVEELAWRIGKPPADVLQRAVAAVDRSSLTVDSELTLDEARDTLAAFGIAAVAQRTISVERGVIVADLASRLGLPAATAVADLALLGITAASGDTLTPAQAAQLARRYDAAVEQTLPVGEELIGIEENPLKTWTDPAPDSPPRAVHHAQLWKVLRRGFQDAVLTVTVTGVGACTVGPMLVNRDQGRGIGFAGSVPDGKDLIFSSEGKVTLDGVDVTNQAWAWQGACFAGSDDDPLHPRDFVFAGAGADPARLAKFAVATPAGALDPGFTFPTAGAPIPMPSLSVGKTRFAFFVQEAHWSAASPPSPSGMPRPHVGFLDGSVFAPAGVDGPHAADLRLSWLDHEAYAVRVLIPQRFALVDHDGILTQVHTALERVRAAGVDVRVEYLDDHWVLGLGAVSGETAEDPILSLRGGSVLNPNPT